jgi:glutaredoxin
MPVKIYSKDNCPRCARVKKTLEEAGIQFDTLIVGEDVSRATVLERYPEARQLPIITRDDVWVSLEDIVQ